MRTPKSPYDQTAGMMYFARMLDKIRLHAQGQLPKDYHANLGLHIGGDGMCCGFLRVDYSELKQRVLSGGNDEEILEWCFAKGRPLNKLDLMIWNEFARKLGWNDRATQVLEKLKAENGLTNRNDIITIFDLAEVDEGRRPRMSGV